MSRNAFAYMCFIIGTILALGVIITAWIGCAILPKWNPAILVQCLIFGVASLALFITGGQLHRFNR